MELPFLKNKNRNQGGGGPIEVTRDGSSDSKLLESITTEFLTAIEKKDRASLKEALRAFMLLMKSEDSDAG